MRHFNKVYSINFDCLRLIPLIACLKIMGKVEIEVEKTAVSAIQHVNFFSSTILKETMSSYNHVSYILEDEKVFELVLQVDIILILLKYYICLHQGK